MLRLTVTLILLSLVAGCATVRTTAGPQHAARLADLQRLANWEFRGRVAFKSGEEGGQASIRWQQGGDSSQIHLAGPFGAGAYDLSWAPEFVSVVDTDGARIVEYHGAAAGEQFLYEQLGWAFPAGSLRYWMLGIADPAAASAEEFAADGSLSGIRQHDWDISFERFAEFDGYILPVRLSMQNAAAKLRIVVSKWSLPADTAM